MEDEYVRVNANIDITTSALQAIVANAKVIAGKNEKGYYRIDTADKVSDMVSLFLRKMDFDAFVKNIDNYR